MSVLTPGYILEISDNALLINGHPMPFSGEVEEAVETVFEQLSQLTLSGAAPGGLGVVIKDSRMGGYGEVSRTIPSGSTVTMDAFVPATGGATPTPQPVEPVTAAVPSPTSAESKPEPISPAPAPEPQVHAPEPVPERAPALSVFARLAQESAARQVAAAPAEPEPAAHAPEPAPQAFAAPDPAAAASVRESVRENPQGAQEAPAIVAAPVIAPVPVAAPSAPVAEVMAPVVSLDAAAVPVSAPAAPANLEAAPEEVDFGSIFKDDEPIIDEGIRTPIGQSLTARQRSEGFSMKSQARREVERRRERKRKLIYSTVAAVTIVAALRIVGAVMAGPSGDYAAVCVDARTLLRQPNATCSANSNPFAQTVYFTVGQAIPAVGAKAPGGAVEKPKDPRSINADVNEGRGGVVLEGGEVK